MGTWHLTHRPVPQVRLAELRLMLTELAPESDFAPLEKTAAVNELIHIILPGYPITADGAGPEPISVVAQPAT